MFPNQTASPRAHPSSPPTRPSWFHQARDAVIDHYPPPSRWREEDRGRILTWPILASAALIFCLAVALLIVSNHDAKSCDETVMFDQWTDERKAGGCKMYDMLQSDWTVAFAGDLLGGAPPMQLTIISVFAHQHLSEDRSILQPTTHVDSTWPIGLSGGAMVFSPVDSGFRVAVDAVFTFPDVDVEVELLGFAFPRDVPHLITGGITIFSQLVINVSDPLYNLSTQADWGPNATAYMLELYYKPLPAAAQQLFSGTWNDFVDGRHLQHCNVCIQDSVQSISWIIILGVAQAASLLHSLVGYCLHYWNNNLLKQQGRNPHEAEDSPRQPGEREKEQHWRVAISAGGSQHPDSLRESLLES